MKTRNNCNNIVIFLGAGFTCDLDFPVMNNFNSASDLQYTGLNVKGNENKEATPILLKAGYIFKRFRTYSSNVNKFMNIDIDNMEDIFCLADIIRATSIDVITDMGGLRIGEIITNIRLWLWKIFQQCPPINSEKETAIANKSIYEQFFQFLIEKHKKHGNISIITTNYDLMPEFFIDEVGGACTYNIQPGYNYNEWKVLPTSSNNFVYINRDNLIPIYKLHGSVNYFFGDEKEKDTINIVTDKLDSDVDGVRNSHANVFRNRPSLFPLDAIVELKNQNNDKIPTPAIIAPMYSKIESMEWLKIIWNHSLKAICNAKLIVFIGYSFPKSDEFMKSFFQAALVSRKISSAPIILNLDRNKDVKCTYCKVFKNVDSNKFLTGTFVEKSDDLMNLIDSYSTSM